MYFTSLKLLKSSIPFKYVKHYCSCKIPYSKFDKKKFAVPSRYLDLPNVWVDYANIAAEHKPVNLGMGFPDFTAPALISKHLADVAKDPDIRLQMTTCPNGHPRLVKAISILFKNILGRELDPYSEIFVSCGAYMGMYCAINGHCQEGDEVIIVDPSFNCYAPQVMAAGAKPVFVPLRLFGKGTYSGDWTFDEDELNRAFNKKTKMFILNTPHNPSGKVFSSSELGMIAELCKKYNTICVSDEVYEWFIFEPNKHIRISTLPDMWDRTITLGSSGKTFGMTGWKTGWAYAPYHLMRNMYQVHRNVLGQHCTPIQEAVARAFEMVTAKLGTPECYLRNLGPMYQKKAEFLCNLLNEVNLIAVKPQAGYFMLADWTPTAHRCDLSNEKDEYYDFKFTKYLGKNFNILFMPVTAFYSSENKKLGESYIRICLVKTDATLKKAAEKLCAWKEWALDQRLE